MVIIVGGSSHVGKTLVAQKLMERTGYPYICMDHLKMGFIRSGMTELTVNDDYKMRFFLWPYVAEIIKTAIENKQNLIVEGCYIPVNWKDSFNEEYMKEIVCKFIVMSESYIRSHSEELKKYADVIEKRLHDVIDIDRLVMCSVNFKADCIKNGTPYIEINDTYNIDDLVNNFYYSSSAQ